MGGTPGQRASLYTNPGQGWAGKKALTYKLGKLGELDEQQPL